MGSAAAHASGMMEQELKLRRSRCDPCLYVGKGMYCLLYVDDMLIVGAKQQAEAFKKRIMERFDMSIDRATARSITVRQAMEKAGKEQRAEPRGGAGRIE